MFFSFFLWIPFVGLNQRHFFHISPQVIKPHYILKTNYRSIQHYSTNLGGKTFSEEEIGETPFFFTCIGYIYISKLISKWYSFTIAWFHVCVTYLKMTKNRGWTLATVGWADKTAPLCGSYLLHLLLGLCWDCVGISWDRSQQSPSQTPTNHPSWFI